MAHEKTEDWSCQKKREEQQLNWVFNVLLPKKVKLRIYWSHHHHHQHHHVLLLLLLISVFCIRYRIWVGWKEMIIITRTKFFDEQPKLISAKSVRCAYMSKQSQARKKKQKHTHTIFSENVLSFFVWVSEWQKILAYTTIAKCHFCLMYPTLCICRIIIIHLSTPSFLHKMYSRLCTITSTH